MRARCSSPAKSQLADGSCLVVPRQHQVNTTSLPSKLLESTPLTEPHLDFEFIPGSEFCCLNSLLVFKCIFVGFHVGKKKKRNLYSPGNVIRMTVQKPEFKLKNIMTEYEELARESL